MSIRLTQDILSAIEKAKNAQEPPTYTRLGVVTNIHLSIFGKYSKGIIKEMDDDTWIKLQPIIQPYLKERVLPILRSFGPNDPPEGTPINTPQPWPKSDLVATKPHEVAPTKLHSIPVISFAQAAMYDQTIEPIDCYALNCSDETALFSEEAKPGYFAFRVEGDSMAPTYPNGTKLLIAGNEFPQRGDLVVAKLNDGQVVFKRYQRKDNVVVLESINAEGRNFEWNIKEQPGYASWIKPVIEVNFKPRDQRFQEKMNGNGGSV